MAQQTAGALGVALAALALGASQALRAGTTLALPDFQHALWASAGLMALAAAWMLRLAPDAGAELSKRP
jgi:hypothetical protein